MTDGKAPSLDFSFDDRVVGRYDALRGHPPAVAGEIAQHFAERIGAGGNLLEIGIGTGRMALPLQAEGIRVVGIDTSLPMLSTLTKSLASQGSTIDLVQADAGALPFRPNSFDAVLCVHVLHLLDDQQATLEQTLKLLRPGGCLLLGRDWVDPASFAGMIRNHFRQAVVELGSDLKFPPGAQTFLQTAIALGAQPVAEGAEQIATEWQTTLSPREVLDGIRSRDDAESWVLPDDLLDKVMERLDSIAADPVAERSRKTPRDASLRLFPVTQSVAFDSATARSGSHPLGRPLSSRAALPG